MVDDQTVMGWWNVEWWGIYWNHGRWNNFGCYQKL